MDKERAGKLNELLKDQDFAKQLFELDTPEEVKDLLSKKGVDVTVDEVNALGQQLSEMEDKIKSGSDELTEDELESAAGGVTPIVAYTLSTTATIIYFAVKKKW